LRVETYSAIQLQIATKNSRGHAMSRSVTFLLAFAFAGAPAAASNYSATLMQPTTARFITRDISWNCGPAACQGATEESRPLVLCQSLAKRAGRVENFLVDGRALASAELERCNASAKAPPTSALADK
jgi:hypothetical protein